MEGRSAALPRSRSQQLLRLSRTATRSRVQGKPVIVVPTMTESTCAIAASYPKASGIKTGTLALRSATALSGCAAGMSVTMAGEVGRENKCSRAGRNSTVNSVFPFHAFTK